MYPNTDNESRFPHPPRSRFRIQSAHRYACTSCEPRGKALKKRRSPGSAQGHPPARITAGGKRGVVREKAQQSCLPGPLSDID